MSLTDIKCKNAKPKEKPYKLADAGGLYIEIMPNGSKYWRLKYRYNAKERRLALGVYPLVTISEAREGRDRAKKLLAAGVDPSQAKRDSKHSLQQSALNTFETVAREWHENQTDRWSEGYSGKVMRCLEYHIFRYLGKRPITQITAPELLESLRKIEKSGHLDIPHGIHPGLFLHSPLPSWL